MTDLRGKVFGLISLGCDKNRVDAEKLLAAISSRGFKITDDINKAQVLIINTCAFLNEARKEAIDTILEYSSYKSENLEKIVVTGCLPQKYISEIFDELVEADVFLGTEDYDRFFEALEKSYEGKVVDCYKGRSSGHIAEDSKLTNTHHR